MIGPLSPIVSFAPEIMARATLMVETTGQGFTKITREAARFVTQTRPKDGALLMFHRHAATSHQVLATAERIEQVTSGDIHGYGIDGEISPTEVCFHG